MSHNRSRAVRRMLAALLCGLLGCVGSACGTPADGPLPATGSTAAAVPADPERFVTRIVAMKTADGERKSIVHHPLGAVSGAPLVVVLHPAAVSARDMEASFGWDAVADREGLVVAYPDGLLDLFQNTWNAGRCCAPATQLGTDDVGFLEALVAALRTTDDIGEVYAVGFSNGGMLAYAWACSEPGTLTGIGVVAGAVMIDCPTPAPLTVIAVHGAADTSIPIEGGPAPDGAVFPPLDASLGPFRAAADCPVEPAVADRPEATVTSWTCTDGHRVVRAVVSALGHAWPGAGPSAGGSATPDDATGFLWAELTR